MSSAHASLSSERRGADGLASRARDRSLFGYVAFGAGALALLGLGAFIARLETAAKHEPEAPPAVTEEVRTPKPSPPDVGVPSTTGPLAERAPVAVKPPPLPKDLAALEALLRASPNRADAAAELARLYAERRDFKKAAERVAQALKAEPHLKTDSRIAAALFQAAQSKAARTASFTLLEGPMGSRGAEILYDLAVDARVNAEVRKRAAAFLQSAAFESVASPALALAVALRNASACEERRTLIKRAKDLGDARSLPYLEKYLERTGCGRRRNEDCAPCLREDATLDDAIFAIKQRAAL